MKLLFGCSHGRDDRIRVALWERGDYCWIQMHLRRIASPNAGWTNYTKIVHSLNRHQGFLNHHGDPSRHSVIRAHFDWLVRLFLPQMRHFPKLLMVACKMITLSRTDESLQSTLRSASRSVSGKRMCSYCNNILGKGAAMIIESLGLCYHLCCFKVRWR